MQFNIISLFPDFFCELQKLGVSGRAYQRGQWQLQIVNPREFALDRHGSVDDRPYGGGAGMVMSYEPLEKSLRKIKQTKLQTHDSRFVNTATQSPAPVIYLSPTGTPLKQEKVQQYAKLKEITLICGRYEGVDQRFVDRHVDEELSIGDFVLSGGEFAALCLIDAVVRLLPQTLNNRESIKQDSFSPYWDGLLDYPHYTRPETIEGLSVPDVLMSGNHEKIAQWRRHQSLKRTLEKRPELINEDRLKELKTHQNLCPKTKN